MDHDLNARVTVPNWNAERHITLHFYIFKYTFLFCHITMVSLFAIEKGFVLYVCLS